MINRANTSSVKSSNTTMGVLADGEVMMVEVVGGRQVLRSILLPVDVGELGGLLGRLWEVGLSTVWVMPGSKLSGGATREWFERVGSEWVVVVHASSGEPDHPVSAMLWPRGSGQWEARRLTFVFPEYAGWEWVLSDAKSLLATVTYLDQVLARPLIDSAEFVARRLLTDLTQNQTTSWVRSSPVDVFSLSRSEGNPIAMMEEAGDLMWMRPLTLVEQRQRYLHKYTHVSRYLEACMTVQLGAGTAQYSSNGRACDDIRPGIWRVRVETASSVFDGKRLPRGVDGEWMSTPQVKCCRDIGYDVQVREGYYWPQSHELLKQWAVTLWQAGERLYRHPQSYRHVEARANAAHTIKLLAQLGVSIIRQKETEGGWYRPDWWVQIVGRSRAALFAHLVRLGRKGVMPVLVGGDALWVVSNDPNPLTAVPGLVNGPKWRGYSVGYEVPLPLSGEVRKAFREVGSAGELVGVVDGLAGGGMPI